MIYCINCGAKNDNFVQTCVRCHQSFSDRQEHFAKKKKEIIIAEYEKIVNDNLVEEEYNDFSDIMPEPLSQEEIDNLKIANANKSIKLKDAIKKDTKKKTSRKRKKN